MLTKFSIHNPTYSPFVDGDPEFATQLNIQYCALGGFDLELTNGKERLWFTFDLKLEDHDEAISSVESLISFLRSYEDHLRRLHRKASGNKGEHYDL